MTRLASHRSMRPTTGAIVLIASLFSAYLAASSSALAQIRRYAAEDPSVTAIYGRGVHAYFAGQLGNAERYLSQAVDAGSRDPRVYYFRAMTRLRMGRRHEAQLDMQIGSALEATNPGQRRSISRALVRVQGNERKMLENYRRQARLQLAQENQQLANQKYGGSPIQPSRGGVVRQPARVPLEQLVGEPSIRVVRPSATPSPMPIEEPQLQSPAPQPSVVETPPAMQGDADVAPAEAVVPAESFVVEPPEPPAATDDSPFGADPPGADDLAEEPAEQPEEDPFGGLSDLEMPSDDQADLSADEANDDPFAEGGVTEIDAADDPPADEPFAFEPDAEKAAEEVPAADDATAEAPAGPTAATSADQSDPKNFLGVLGRIVGSATPKISPPELPEFPSVGAPGAAQPQADEFDFGPEVQFEPATEDFGAEMPTEEPEARQTSEQPLPEAEVDEEPFGDDPFGGFGVEEEEAPSETAEGDATEEEPVTDESEATAEQGDAEETTDEEAANEEATDEEADADDNPLDDDDDPFGGFGDF